jgi:hypothetical protein
MCTYSIAALSCCNNYYLQLAMYLLTSYICVFLLNYTGRKARDADTVYAASTKVEKGVKSKSV